MEQSDQKRKILSDNGRILLEKFISIFITALLSALITFLQSILDSQSAIESTKELAVQSGTIGAALRGTIEFIKHKPYV